MHKGLENAAQLSTLLIVYSLWQVLKVPQEEWRR